MSTVLKNAFSIRHYSFWIGVFLSSLIGAFAYFVTQRSIESDAHGRFLNHTTYAQNNLVVRLKSYSDLLRASASTLQSVDRLSHRQFHDYVSSLRLASDYPALDFINFASYVRDDERDAFVDTLRKEKQFLGAISNQLNISPPERRPAYLAVSYIEPQAQVPKLYGYDLMANPYFGDTLARERDDGTIQVAGTPIPQLSRPNDVYLGMRMPVYRPGKLLMTVEERRAAYRGSIGLAFSVPKLLKGVMDSVSLPHMRLTLFDTGPHVDDVLIDPSKHKSTLFDSNGTAANPEPAPDAGPDNFTVTLSLTFYGRPWHVTYSAPKSALYTGFDAAYPKLMMMFGFSGAMLLYTLLYTLTSSRRAALSLAQEMTKELRESQNKLQLSHQKLRRMADHAYQIKELERKRIAREIHDDLGQNLLALRIEAEMLATRTHAHHGKLHTRARATLSQIDIIIKSVRQIINDLRPNVLDLGLSAAVEWQASQFQRRTGIACTVRDDHGDIPLPDHCATAFFRILQESLTNIVRHANATRVDIDLRLNAGWLSLTVRDNGCGLPPGGYNKFDSFGLVGIEERIVILGGTCTVFSEPGNGTTVMVTAPVIDPPPNSLSFQVRESGSHVI